MTQSCDSHLEYHPGHLIEPPRFLLTMTQRSSLLPTLYTKGLYQYNRLPLNFGISSAPPIFQRAMEGMLQGIPGVSIYIDDIIW